jgi:hypothetical protein
MENSLTGIDDSDMYIDDFGAFSTSWETHLELLDTFLHHLKENSFTVNLFKCK